MTHAPAAKREEGDEQKPKHPDIDGGWGWWVVFASFMIHIVSKLNYVHYDSSVYFEPYQYFTHVISLIIHQKVIH